MREGVREGVLEGGREYISKGVQEEIGGVIIILAYALAVPGTCIEKSILLGCSHTSGIMSYIHARHNLHLPRARLLLLRPAA